MSFFSPRLGGVLVLLVAILILATVTWMRVRIGARTVTELEALAQRLGARYVAFPGDLPSVPPIARAVETLETLRAPTRLRDVFELDFEDARLYAFEHVVEGLMGDPSHVRLGTHRLALLYVLDEPLKKSWLLVPRELSSQLEQLARGSRRALSGDEAFDREWIATASDPQVLEELASLRTTLAPLGTFTIEAHDDLVLFLAQRGEVMTANVDQPMAQSQRVLEALPSLAISLAAAPPRPTQIELDVGLDRNAIREEAKASLRKAAESEPRP